MYPSVHRAAGRDIGTEAPAAESSAAAAALLALTWCCRLAFLFQYMKLTQIRYLQWTSLLEVVHS
jgi:hypothetical protein